jgi:hypothetical protein
MVDYKGYFTKYKMPITIVLLLIIGYIIFVTVRYYQNRPSDMDTNSKLLLNNVIQPSDDNTIDKLMTDNVLMAMSKDDAKKEEGSDKLTVHFFVKLVNMTTNYGTKKNIIFKSASSPANYNDPSFEFSFRPTVNDIEFRIKVGDKNNSYYDSVIINDIPLSVWTSISCVVDGNKVNIYKNGAYYKSKVLSGITSFINTPLLIGQGYTDEYKGIVSYNGYFGGLYYSYKVESEDYLRSLTSTKLIEPKKKERDDPSKKCKPEISLGGLTNLVEGKMSGMMK